MKTKWKKMGHERSNQKGVMMTQREKKGERGERRGCKRVNVISNSRK